MNPAPVPVSIVVDVANVMGARADGWWRDRAGAALRLCQEIAALAERGIAPAALPADIIADLPADGAGGLPGVQPDGSAGQHDGPTGRVRPVFTVVLEGRSRAAAAGLESYLEERPEDAACPMRVITAPGSGDEYVVTETVSAVSSGASCLTVTADRELRRRCSAVGGKVTGPGWLLHLL